MFQYFCKTGASGLRGHIYRYHLLEYVTLVEQNGWYVWLDSIKSAVAHGYTLAAIRDILTDGGSIASLAPHGHDTSASNSTHPNKHASIPSFTLQELHNHLIAFIIVDDQVLPFKSNITHSLAMDQSLNIIECKEFHKLLLLLRQDLKDSDIPHRTKIRENIITAWQTYFAMLKDELAVSCIVITLSLIFTPSFTAFSWMNFAHGRHMVK
jgi:hypothetical protein